MNIRGPEKNKFDNDLRLANYALLSAVAAEESDEAYQGIRYLQPNPRSTLKEEERRKAETVQLYLNYQSTGILIANLPPVDGCEVIINADCDGNVSEWTDTYVPVGTDHVLWRGVYTLDNAPYAENEMTREGDWLMIANKETYDPPAPVENGVPSKDAGSAFADQQHLGVVNAGHIYEFTEPGWIKSVEVQATVLSADVNNRVLLLNITDPDNIETFIQGDPVLTEDAWVPVGFGNIPVSAGTRILVLHDLLNSGSSTALDGGWTAGIDKANPEDIPGVQAWNRDKHEMFNFTRHDLDNVDRLTELMGVVTGSTLQITEVGAPTNSWTMTVDAEPVSYPIGATGLDITHVSFETTRIENTGDPVVGNPTSCHFDVPVPALTDYPQGVGAPTASWATITGYLRLSGVETTPDASHGVRLEFQPATISPDWDMASYI